jgi:hypothetical protein
MKKMILSALIVMSILMGMASSVSAIIPSDSLPLFTYTGDMLPSSDGWRILAYPTYETTGTTIVNGTLHINDPNTYSRSAIHYIRGWDVVPEFINVAEFDIKGVSCSETEEGVYPIDYPGLYFVHAGVYFGISDGRYNMLYTVYPNRVVSFHRNNLGLSIIGSAYYIDTTKEFNTYKVFIEDGIAKLFINEELVLKEMAGTGVFHGRGIEFGAGSSPGTGEAFFDEIRAYVVHPPIPMPAPTPTPIPSSEIELLYQDKDDNGIWIEIYGSPEPPLNNKVDYVVFITLAEGKGHICDIFESVVYVAYPDDCVNTYLVDERLTKILYENEERWYSQNIAEGLKKHEEAMGVLNILMSVAYRIPGLWEAISSQMLPSEAVPPENSVFFDDNTNDILVVPFSCTGGVEEKEIVAPNNLRHLGPDTAYCLVVPTEFTEARPADLHFFIAVKKGEGLGQGFTHRHTKDIVIRIKPRTETGNEPLESPATMP